MSDELSEVTIGPFEAGDEHGILAAFKKVFDVDRPLDVWRWEYADNPAGLHCFLGKLPNGQVISQFTGIPRTMSLGGERRCFSEIVDSLTDPEFRRGLKKPGLFATTCYRFVDHYGNPDGEIVMYGLPNPPAFRVGRALLGYVFLYELEFVSTEFSDPPARPTDELADGAGRAQTVEQFSADADDLAARFEQSVDIMTVRDQRYLNWRYPSRPDVDYDLVEFRDADGALFGLAALHHGWRGLPVTVACEWLVPSDHPAAAATLTHLQARSADLGSHQLKILARPHGPDWEALRRHGWHPEPTQFTFVARTYDPTGVPISRLKEGWYLSCGDFDIA